MLANRYDPRDHYWIVAGDETHVWSSLRRALVVSSDATYQTWLADPAHYVTRTTSWSDLYGVLVQQAPEIAAEVAASWVGAGHLTQSQELDALEAAGLAITSTGTSSLNGTYSVGPAAQSNLMGLLLGFSLRGVFPGGGSSFAYQDAAGTPHTMTQPEMQAVGAAVEDFVAEIAAARATIAAGGSPTIPPGTATIA